MDYWILLKIVIVYILILIVMKFMGKREIGQLSLFDFAVILIIADIAVIGLENKDDFLVYLMGIVLLGLIQKLLALIQLRFPKIRGIIDDKQSLIIIEGKLNIKEMKKQSYNIDDLIIQLRLKNIRSISEVRFLILETNGDISVFKYDEFKGQGNTQNVSTRTKNPTSNSVSNSLMKEETGKEIYPFPVIVSGEIVDDSLKILNISKDFVEKEIKRQGYKDIKEIYYANYEYGKLFIAKTCDF